MLMLDSFPFRCHVGDLLQTVYDCNSRFYFRIGSRCWFAATTIAVGATVLGQDSHPGYKLLASAVPWHRASMVHLKMGAEVANLDLSIFHGSQVRFLGNCV